jgi:hypothetical protein
MISFILIDALARRAMQVIVNVPSPTVPVLRAAFEDELRRFDNSTVHTPTSATAPVRAKLVPDANIGSLGRGLGQTTGGTAQSDAEEVRRILKIISDVSTDDIILHCGSKASAFVADIRNAASFGPAFRVTGKQLFYAREIRDKLVYKGVV